MAKKVLIIILFQLFTFPCLIYAQSNTWQANSWAEVFRNKSGTVTALWYDIEPFIYTNSSGQLMGVEYEVMESLKQYLKKRYAISLQINWINAGSFENIYEQVKKSKRMGIFGWSYYSITAERKKEVSFTPPYMPDLNILVTNNSQPLYENADAFISGLTQMEAYTMQATTMEEDTKILKEKFCATLKIIDKYDDYDILRHIAANKNAFGYVPLSTYIVGLQKGIKVKRQNIMISRRDGFAGVMPYSTDWASIMNEYFNTNEFKIFAAKVVSKYLGDEVTDLVFGASTPDSLANIKNDLDLVTMEKEIVTQRLIDAAIDSQKEKIFRNAIIVGAVIVLIFILILYSRFVSNQRFSKLLQHRNDTIIHQKGEIEMMNKRLEMKVLLSQMNPHLIFNSLNAIQYFVTLDDKKNATRYINNFSRHLRLILATASASSVILHDEIKMLNQYLQLEQLRFENKFDYAITIDKQQLSELLEIPPMLIYPYVEAALYQGVLLKKEGKGLIEINFSKKEAYVVITVQNNGEGTDAANDFLSKRDGKEFNNSINTALEHMELLNYRQEERVQIQQYNVYNNSQIIGSMVEIRIPVNIIQLQTE